MGFFFSSPRQIGRWQFYLKALFIFLRPKAGFYRLKETLPVGTVPFPYLSLLMVLNELFGREPMQVTQPRLHHDGHLAQGLLDAFGNPIHGPLDICLWWITAQNLNSSQWASVVSIDKPCLDSHIQYNPDLALENPSYYLSGFQRLASPKVGWVRNTIPTLWFNV